MYTWRQHQFIQIATDCITGARKSNDFSNASDATPMNIGMVMQHQQDYTTTTLVLSSVHIVAKIKIVTLYIQRVPNVPINS